MCDTNSLNCYYKFHCGSLLLFCFHFREVKKLEKQIMVYSLDSLFGISPLWQSIGCNTGHVTQNLVQSYLLFACALHWGVTYGWIRKLHWGSMLGWSALTITGRWNLIQCILSVYRLWLLDLQLIGGKLNKSRYLTFLTVLFTQKNP